MSLCSTCLCGVARPNCQRRQGISVPARDRNHSRQVPHWRRSTRRCLTACTRQSTLFKNPASDVLGTPDRDAGRQLHRLWKGASLNPSPQGGLGDGNKHKHLSLPQKTGFRQDRRWDGGNRHVYGGNRSGIGHDLASSRHAPSMGVTGTVAAALGQDGARR